MQRVIHNRFIDHRRSCLRRRLTVALQPAASDDGMSMLEQIPSDDMGPDELPLETWEAQLSS